MRDGGARPKPEEFAPLAERMKYLNGLRLSFGFLALLWVLVDPSSAPIEGVAVATGGYLLLAGSSEWVRRQISRRELFIIAGMLLLDGLYLAWVRYLTGGSGSPLRFLPYLHLVGVTLLASYRTGLKLALWHSLLLFVMAYGQASGLLQMREGEAGLPGARSFEVAAMINVAALWAVALGTATFSSLNERELRRRKADLELMAAMISELDRRLDPAEIGRILLARLQSAFGFSRGTVLASDQGDLAVLACTDGAEPAALDPGVDPVVERAWNRREVVLVRRLDPRTDPRLASVLPGARNLIVAPLFAEGDPLGAVAVEHDGRASRIERWTVAVTAQFASHAALALRNGWLFEEIKRMAETDPLTGVANRRVFETALKRELSRAARTGAAVSLLMLDVDHFKRYNDEHGHQAGDDVLSAVAQALAESSRVFDTVARYGGEEFAVILPECSAEEALLVAERLRRQGAAAGTEAPVTLSGGLATFPYHAVLPADLIHAADVALYRSKRAGRDRLTVAGEAEAPAASRSWSDSRAD